MHNVSKNFFKPTKRRLFLYNSEEFSTLSKTCQHNFVIITLTASIAVSVKYM